MYETIVKKPLFSLLLKVVLFLSALILLKLTLSSLLVRANIILSDNENVIYTTNSVFLIVELFLVFFMLICSQKILKKIDEKKLFVLCSFFLIFAGFILIFGSYSSIKADARHVFHAAIQMNRGDFSSLEKSAYLGIYPFQLGLVTYERILLLFSSSPRVLYITNLLMVIGINFLIWRSVLLFPKMNTLTVKYLIVAMFLFLPQFFFIMFGYGTIPGFFFLVAACFCSIKFIQSNKYRFLCLSVIFITLSCLLKNNFTIGAIAMACMYLLFFLLKKRFSFLIAMICILVVPSVSTNVLIDIYSETTGISISSGMPKILWITMGLQKNENCLREGGWYNSYSYGTYHIADFDAKAASEKGKEDLRKEVQKFLKNPSYMGSFFTKKIVSTWLEPSYQSIWSGPISSLSFEGSHHLMITRNLYGGGKLFKLVIHFMQISMILIFGLSSYYYFICLKNLQTVNMLAVFSGIYFIGGFLFHLVWETKSQYVYTYVFFLIIPACLGMMDIQGKIRNALKN